LAFATNILKYNFRLKGCLKVAVAHRTFCKFSCVFNLLNQFLSMLR